jgi:hypothetical protein
VSWRRSNDYLAWAPLPPAYDEGVSIEINARGVPDYYWQVVPNRDFLSDDLPRRIVRDKDRFNPILRETQPLGNVTINNNNVVVNNAVNVTYVEEKTNEKVVVHKVEKTGDEKNAGKVKGDAIQIFQPAADKTPDPVAPPKPKQIEEVAGESKTKEQGGGAPSTDQLLVPPEIKTPPLPEAAQTGPSAAQGTKDGQPATGEAAPPPPPPPPPAEETASPQPAEEAAPPPPPPPAEETASPPPPPPPVEEAAPPPPPAPAEETAAPPPSPAEEVTPPPAPPAPPVGEEAPKVKKGDKPKPKKENGEDTQPPPPPPPPPPPQEESAPLPPPPTSEEAPKPDKKGKFKNGNGEEMQPGEGPGQQMMPPPPPQEEVAPPPQPPSNNVPPEANQKNGKGKHKKGNSEEPAPCPEGMVPLDDGTCAVPQ